MPLGAERAIEQRFDQRRVDGGERGEGGHSRAHPMIMVGPVAVVPERQHEGFGKALMLATLGALEPGALPQVMIGDPDYYGRFFGFVAAPTARWHCPGPFDPARLLVRCENAAVLPAEGMLGPWPGPLAN